MATKLFGTDGIRGQAGQFPLDDTTVHAIGQALAGQIAKSRNPNVLIGMDTRESGMHIVRLLAAGLAAGGAAHEFAGVVPTPAVAYATQHGQHSLGVMVSASHNPFEDNGIKVFGPFGYKLPEEMERTIEGRVDVSLAQQARVREIEPLDEPDVAARYVRHLLRAADVSPRARNLRFVVDCANGAASEVAPIMFEALGMDVKYIACAPNGRNINLDCGALHLQALAEEVVSSGADFGAALDGDADRCLFVDEAGHELNGDNMLLLMAQSLKRRDLLPDSLVVATVMSNLGLELALQDEGIRLLRTAVGDKYVIDEMLTTGAALGGEQSGHLIFGAHSTTGDGLLGLLMMLRTVTEEGAPCSELRSRLKRLPQQMINVRVREKRPLEQLPEIRAAVAARELDLAGRGRVVIRYSGTEPVVRVMVEAASQRDVVQHCTEIAKLFEKHLGQ